MRGREHDYLARALTHFSGYADEACIGMGLCPNVDLRDEFDEMATHDDASLNPAPANVVSVEVQLAAHETQAVDEGGKPERLGTVGRYLYDRTKDAL